MSTLEELKKQAEEAKLEEADKTQSSAMKEQAKWKQLAPVMKYLHSHFKELADTLNILEKESYADFDINDDIILKNLRAQNYGIIYPGDDKEKEFIFQFENKGEFPHYCKVAAGPIADNLVRILKENNIGFSRKPVDKKFLKFEIKTYIRTRYHFSADLEKEKIRLSITNYDGLWKQNNSFSRSEITQDMVDALTNHAMRKKNNYNEITGNVISDDARTELREKLKKAQEEKARKEAALEQQHESKKEKTLIGRLFKK